MLGRKEAAPNWKATFPHTKDMNKTPDGCPLQRHTTVEMTSRPMQPPGPLPNRPYPQVAQAPRLNPIFRLLLLGIHASKSSPLRVLRRDCNATMLIFEAMEELWDSHVDCKSFQGDYNQGFASGYNFNFYWGPERNFGHIMKRPPPPKRLAPSSLQTLQRHHQSLLASLSGGRR
ncbi:hypothetical protein DFJ73DRAFT_123420 [Zopfochytrium polystomum]|nr:hypothetical protein DFJ73DRAFT_123420 [Zopfochytrium polystomum]